jgi:hypothetical protein
MDPATGELYWLRVEGVTAACVLSADEILKDRWSQGDHVASLPSTDNTAPAAAEPAESFRFDLLRLPRH